MFWCLWRNDSCHKHFVLCLPLTTKRRRLIYHHFFYQQWVSPIATVRCGCVYNTWRSRRRQHAMKPGNCRESRFLPITHLHSTPSLRQHPVEILPQRFVRKKIEWCGYTTVKKVWRYVYTFRQNTPEAKLNVWTSSRDFWPMAIAIWYCAIQVMMISYLKK